MEITYLDDFYLAGAKFYQLPWVMNELKVGTEVMLSPDPENRYDENAVEVEFNEHKLGFIPRANNGNLQKLLLANVNIIAHNQCAKSTRRTMETGQNNTVYSE